MDYPTAEDTDYHAQWLVEPADCEPANKQDNHDDLADYLEKHFRAGWLR